VTSHEWWLQGCAAAILGALAGIWVAWLVLHRRFDAQLRRNADELLQRHATSADQLRNSQLRAQTELELARSEFRRHMSQASQEHGTAKAKLEEHLIAAYDEVNRLRASTRVTDAAPTELTDGFAATQPMVDGL